MKHALYLVIVMSFFACGQQHIKTVDTEKKTNEVSITSLPFVESDSLILSPGLTYKVLFTEGDTVYNTQKESAPAKGSQDLVVYLPNNGSSTVGKLFVSHESASVNDKLGHGGGATIMAS